MSWIKPVGFSDRYFVDFQESGEGYDDIETQPSAVEDQTAKEKEILIELKCCEERNTWSYISDPLNHVHEMIQKQKERGGIYLFPDDDVIKKLRDELKL